MMIVYFEKVKKNCFMIHLLILFLQFLIYLIFFLFIYLFIYILIYLVKYLWIGWIIHLSTFFLQSLIFNAHVYRKVMSHKYTLIEILLISNMKSVLLYDSYFNKSKGGGGIRSHPQPY